MGLDALDLVFRLEKRFGIKISHVEGYAVLFDTVGTIHRYLVAKLHGEYPQTPRIEPLFAEVSGAVNRIVGRWKFTSSLDLNKLFPPAKRRDNWHFLETSLRVSLPALEQLPDEKFPRVPHHCASSISLAYWIAEHYPDRVEWVPVSCERTDKIAARPWSEAEIWTILTESICGALGVKPEEVKYDARLVEDLGMT
ncbi:MAG: acyl carrier protein [Patescibacteria group bacterium]|nr:acyl carrier protein [Patescibacteria group bacterium]